MKILVTGSRTFQNWKWLEEELLKAEPTIVIHGAAQGADFTAEAICKKHQINYRGYPAKWNKFGKSAGPIRNQEMLNIEHRKDEPIDLCLAFPVGIGKGTGDMIDRCQQAGIPTKVNGTLLMERV